MKLINVMAASLDGKIAAHTLESDSARRDYGFTNEDDKAYVRQQLETADAVITGANSLRASGATWQVRNHRGRFATWVVMTTKGISADLPFWNQNQVERWIVAPTSVPMHSNENTRAIICGETDPARVAYVALVAAGYERVLLFGGGQINRLFYQSDLVDELRLTICPIIIAGNDAPDFVDRGLPSPKHLTLLSSQPSKDLVFLTYKVQKT